MEKAIVRIPTAKEELKVFNKNIYQLEKGCLAQLEKDNRSWMDKEYFIRWDGVKKRISCKFPICCEFCKYCGDAYWHCHNPKSFKYCININPNDLCSKWEPNIGLMILLWDRIISKRETGAGFHLKKLGEENE